MVKILLFLLFIPVLGLNAQDQPSLGERDFKQWKDSMEQVKNEKRYQEALERLSAYEANNRIDTLEMIDLSFTRLTKLPEFMDQAMHLKRLNLSGTSISKLKSLKQYDSLSYLKLNKLDARVKLPKLKRLETLYLEENALAAIPRSVKKSKSIKRLYLTSNQIKGSPRWLKKLVHLREIKFDFNPVDLNEMKFHRFPDSLTIVKFNNCNIEKVPATVYQLSTIDLQFRENKIEELPIGISDMPRLRKLALYKNKIKILPNDLYEVKKLQSLDLYYNDLKTISPKFANFDSLSILYLSHNQFESVPEEIGEMINLEELYLHHNQLNDIPKSISNLRKLKVLRINENQITVFPEQILALEQLEYLDVSDNLLETIPGEIVQLRNLQLFSYNHNQIAFNDPLNHHLAVIIPDMMARGVRCIPEISEVENQ